MNTDPQQILQQYFKLPTFRPGQQQTIKAILNGESALVVFPTGGGKSLCYQLPAIMLEGVTIVISPLIALMQDQVDTLQGLGIAAERMDSSRSGDEIRNIYQRLRNSCLKLLYVAPERLQNERFLSVLRQIKISMMAVDEAHCISEWGHNFRPDYLKLASLSKELQVERILGLTATATPDVARDICQQFSIPDGNHVQTGFYRPNLQLQVAAFDHQSRVHYLFERIEGQPDAPTIVYVTLQKTAEWIAKELTIIGINAKAYHAGLKADVRENIQNAFMSGEVNIIVATIAFGMGIDKSNVRAIYHYNLPKSLENYMQEIGRAGRDGKAADCELLVCPEDVRVLENFSYGDTPIEEHLTNLIRTVLSQGDIFDISTYELSSDFDIRPLVVNTALTYLELEGIIRATGPFYTTYQIQFLEPQDTVVNRFDADRANFLNGLFKQGKQGRRWLSIDLNEAEAALGDSRERMIKALQYLEEQGWIETQVKGIRQGYRRLTKPDIRPLSQRLNQLFLRREQQDLKRIQMILAYSQTPQCLPKQLCHYFGEQLEHDCGQCSYCRKQKALDLPAQHSPQLSEKERQIIDELFAKELPALAHPKQITRFLCGLPSPAATRSGLKQDPAFGQLAEHAFQTVLQQVNAREADHKISSERN